MSTNKLVDRALLKTLVPPNALNPENFQELAGKAFVEEVAAGRTIFKAGELDRKTTYLLEGEVSITSAKGVTTTLSATSDVARHPLVNNQPRQHTVVAKTACRITRFDSDLLDILLTWDQLSGIEVSEIQSAEQDEDSSDWMMRILQSKAFLKVPPANIQAMFMRMQERPVTSGEVVIRQGDDGDFYYIIKSGKAKVTRLGKNGAELVLAQLSEGDAFGEEALLSEAKRNATITMTTDGVLMRLAKEDFNALLKAPMLSRVSFAEAEALVAKGACWLDVRLETEFSQTGLPGSVNVPLFMLRLKADSLDSARHYIVYCDTGRRSSAAAFLLGERGFRVSLLADGLMSRAGKGSPGA